MYFKSEQDIKRTPLVTPKTPAQGFRSVPKCQWSPKLQTPLTVNRRVGWGRDTLWSGLYGKVRPKRGTFSGRRYMNGQQFYEFEYRKGQGNFH